MLWRYAPGLWEHFGITVTAIDQVPFEFFLSACDYVERLNREASKPPKEGR